MARSHPTNTHNSVVQALKEILSSAGRIVKKATQIEVDSNKYPLNRDHVGITGQAPTCNWCHPCIKRCTLYRSFNYAIDTIIIRILYHQTAHILNMTGPIGKNC